MTLPRDAEDADFEGLELADETVDGHAYERCRFVRCRFENVRFRKTRFEECQFVDCEFVACRFDDTALREARFEGGRLMGVDWTGARPFGLEMAFDGCRLDHSVFFELKLTGVSFERCRMHEVDFGHCDLRKARFVECDLRGANLRHTDLSRADLSTARGVRVQPEICTLDQTRLSLEAVAPLVADLGIDCPELTALLGG